jgi:hypothetical protein
MPNARLTSIPNDLRVAFCQAVIELHDWKPPAPEPTVTYGLDHFPIGGICGFVNIENFAPDEMPEELVRLILRLLKPDPNYPLLDDRTFQGGARYIVGLIQEHKRARREVDRMSGRSSSY